jgi:oligopeptide/dipeptide ABC transporter ATP-binding protein
LALPRVDDGPVLEIEDLRVSFATSRGSVKAVRGASLELRSGETLGLVGESGSGKTTVLMSILQLLPENARVDGGRVLYGGRDLLTLPPREIRALRGRQLCLIPQRAMQSLSPVASIGSQLRRFAEIGTDEKATNPALLKMLQRVGLNLDKERLHGYPHEFSGGQLQRMLIAASALAGRPSVLLADEPTSTLDATVQAQVLNVLKEVQQDLGLSVIFVTHDLGVVAQLCDRVAVMYAGEVVETAEVNALFRDPKHPYTQALLGTLPGRHRRGERLTSIAGSVTDSAAIEEGCRFTPRCPHAMDVCITDHPDLRSAGQSEVGCHLYRQSVTR